MSKDKLNLTLRDFVKRIREKYPEYKDRSDDDVADEFLRKYPVYASQINDLPQDYRILRGSTGRADLDEKYERMGRQYGIDPNVLMEQGRQETGNWNQRVLDGRRRSTKGATGIGQFMPDTARRFGLRVDKDVDERTDIDKSLDAQARYMRELLDKFNGNYDLALAGYNAGENRRSLREGRIPNIKETRDYVSAINRNLGKLPGGSRDPLTRALSQQQTGVVQQTADVQQIGQQQQPQQQQPPKGLRRPGTVDVSKQPTITNPDGTISTVESFSIGTDEGEVLLPTITPDGKRLTKEEAIAAYREGKLGDLGVFDTPENATAYARQLSQNQGAQRQNIAAEKNQREIDDIYKRATDEGRGLTIAETERVLGLTQGIEAVQQAREVKNEIVTADPAQSPQGLREPAVTQPGSNQTAQPPARQTRRQPARQQQQPAQQPRQNQFKDQITLQDGRVMRTAPDQKGVAKGSRRYIDDKGNKIVVNSQGKAFVEKTPFSAGKSHVHDALLRKNPNLAKDYDYLFKSGTKENRFENERAKLLNQIANGVQATDAQIKALIALGNQTYSALWNKVSGNKTWRYDKAALLYDPGWKRAQAEYEKNKGQGQKHVEKMMIDAIRKGEGVDSQLQEIYMRGRLNAGLDEDIFQRKDINAVIDEEMATLRRRPDVIQATIIGGKQKEKDARNQWAPSKGLEIVDTLVDRTGRGIKIPKLGESGKLFEAADYKPFDRAAAERDIAAKLQLERLTLPASISDPSGLKMREDIKRAMSTSTLMAFTVVDNVKRFEAFRENWKDDKDIVEIKAKYGEAAAERAIVSVWDSLLRQLTAVPEFKKLSPVVQSTLTKQAINSRLTLMRQQLKDDAKTEHENLVKAADRFKKNEDGWWRTISAVVSAAWEYDPTTDPNIPKETRERLKYSNRRNVGTYLTRLIQGDEIRNQFFEANGYDPSDDELEKLVDEYRWNSYVRAANLAKIHSGKGFSIDEMLEGHDDEFNSYIQAAVASHGSVEAFNNYKEQRERDYRGNYYYGFGTKIVAAHTLNALNGFADGMLSMAQGLTAAPTSIIWRSGEALYNSLVSPENRVTAHQMENNPLYQLWGGLKTGASYLTLYQDVINDSFAGHVTKGIGNAGSFIATGFGTGKVLSAALGRGAARAMSPVTGSLASKLITRGSKVLFNPKNIGTTVAIGRNTGTVLAGAGQMIPSIYEDMRRNGIDPDTALFLGTVLGTGLGATEIFGIGGAISRRMTLMELGHQVSPASIKMLFDSATRDRAKSILWKKTVDLARAEGRAIGRESTEEFFQELTQNTIQDAAVKAIAADNIDDAFKIVKFITELPSAIGRSLPAAAVGAVVGGIVGGGMAAIQHRSEQRGALKAEADYYDGLAQQSINPLKINILGQEYDTPSSVVGRMQELKNKHREGAKLLAAAARTAERAKKEKKGAKRDALWAKAQSLMEQGADLFQYAEAQSDIATAEASIELGLTTAEEVGATRPEFQLQVGSIVRTAKGVGRVTKINEKNGSVTVEYNAKQKDNGEIIFQSVADFRSKQVVVIPDRSAIDAQNDVAIGRDVDTIRENKRIADEYVDELVSLETRAKEIQAEAVEIQKQSENATPEQEIELETRANELAAEMEQIMSRRDELQTKVDDMIGESPIVEEQGEMVEAPLSVDETYEVGTRVKVKRGSNIEEADILEDKGDTVVVNIDRGKAKDSYKIELPKSQVTTMVSARSVAERQQRQEVQQTADAQAAPDVEIAQEDEGVVETRQEEQQTQVEQTEEKEQRTEKKTRKRAADATTEEELLAAQEAQEEEEIEVSTEQAAGLGIKRKQTQETGQQTEQASNNTEAQREQDRSIDKAREVFNTDRAAGVEQMSKLGLTPDEIVQETGLNIDEVNAYLGEAKTSTKEQTDNKLDAKIDAARDGDTQAQAELDEYGIEWKPKPVFRFISKEELGALLEQQLIEGRFGAQTGADVTSSATVTTAASAQYRVTFKTGGEYDYAREGSRVQFKNEQDGYIRGGYDLSDVALIERIDENGNVVEIVYTASGAVEQQPQMAAADEQNVARQGMSDSIENDPNKAEKATITYSPVYTLNVLRNDNLIGMRGKTATKARLMQLAQQNKASTIEKSIIASVLDEMFEGKSENDKMPYNEFEARVRLAIIPLTEIKTSKTRDPLRGVADGLAGFGFSNLQERDEQNWSKEARLFNAFLDHSYPGHFVADYIRQADEMQYGYAEAKNVLGETIFIVGHQSKIDEINSYEGEVKSSSGILTTKTKEEAEAIVNAYNNKRDRHGRLATNVGVMFFLQQFVNEQTGEMIMGHVQGEGVQNIKYPTKWKNFFPDMIFQESYSLQDVFSIEDISKLEHENKYSAGFRHGVTSQQEMVVFHYINAYNAGIISKDDARGQAIAKLIELNNQMQELIWNQAKAQTAQGIGTLQDWLTLPVLHNSNSMHKTAYDKLVAAGRTDLINLIESPLGQTLATNIKESHLAWQSFLENHITAQDRQFIDSAKEFKLTKDVKGRYWQLRAVREAMADAAKRGIKKVFFLAPSTNAMLQGHTMGRRSTNSALDADLNRTPGTEVDASELIDPKVAQDALQNILRGHPVPAAVQEVVDSYGVMHKQIMAIKEMFPGSKFVVRESGLTYLEVEVDQDRDGGPQLVTYAASDSTSALDRRERLASKDTMIDEKFLDGVGSIVDKSGNVRLTFEAAELLRRLWSTERDGKSVPAIIFDAVHIRREILDSTISKVEDAIRQLTEAGYNAEEIAGVTRLLDNLRKLEASGKGIAYVNENKLFHERIHDLRYIRSLFAKSVRDYYKNFTETFNKLLGTNKTAYENYFKAKYFNNKEFDQLTQEEKAQLHEETFVAIVDNDYAKLGITDVQAAEFITTDLEAYVEKHGPEILDDLETLLNEKINKGALVTTLQVIKTINAAKKQSTQTTESVQGVQGGEQQGGVESTAGTESTAEGSSGGTADSTQDGDTDTATDEDARERKERRTPGTVAANTSLDVTELEDAVRYYEPKNRTAEALAAQKWLQELGFDGAYAQAFGMAPSAQSTARRMALMEFIDDQIVKAMEEGNEGKAKAWHDKLVNLASAMAVENTEYGQAISQLARWSDINPESIVSHVQTKLSSKNQESRLTLEEADLLRSQAEEIASLRKKLEETRKPKDKKAAEKREKLKREMEDALAALSQQFPSMSATTDQLVSRMNNSDNIGSRLETNLANEQEYTSKDEIEHRNRIDQYDAIQTIAEEVEAQSEPIASEEQGPQFAAAAKDFTGKATELKAKYWSTKIGIGTVDYGADGISVAELVKTNRNKADEAYTQAVEILFKQLSSNSSKFQLQNLTDSMATSIKKYAEAVGNQVLAGEMQRILKGDEQARNAKLSEIQTEQQRGLSEWRKIIDKAIQHYSFQAELKATNAGVMPETMRNGAPIYEEAVILFHMLYTVLHKIQPVHNGEFQKEKNRGTNTINGYITPFLSVVFAYVRTWMENSDTERSTLFFESYGKVNDDLLTAELQPYYEDTVTDTVDAKWAVFDIHAPNEDRAKLARIVTQYSVSTPWCTNGNAAYFLGLGKLHVLLTKSDTGAYIKARVQSNTSHTNNEEEETKGLMGQGSQRIEPEFIEETVKYLESKRVRFGANNHTKELYEISQIAKKFNEQGEAALTAQERLKITKAISDHALGNSGASGSIAEIARSVEAQFSPLADVVAAARVLFENDELLDEELIFLNDENTSITQEMLDKASIIVFDETFINQTTTNRSKLLDIYRQLEALDTSNITNLTFYNSKSKELATNKRAANLAIVATDSALFDTLRPTVQGHSPVLSAANIKSHSQSIRVDTFFTVLPNVTRIDGSATIDVRAALLDKTDAGNEFSIERAVKDIKITLPETLTVNDGSFGVLNIARYQIDNVDMNYDEKLDFIKEMYPSLDVTTTDIPIPITYDADGNVITDTVITVEDNQLETIINDGDNSSILPIKTQVDGLKTIKFTTQDPNSYYDNNTGNRQLQAMGVDLTELESIDGGGFKAQVLTGEEFAKLTEITLPESNTFLQASAGSTIVDTDVRITTVGLRTRQDSANITGQIAKQLRAVTGTNARSSEERKALTTTYHTDNKESRPDRFLRPTTNSALKSLKTVRNGRVYTTVGLPSLEETDMLVATRSEVHFNGRFGASSGVALAGRPISSQGTMLHQHHYATADGTVRIPMRRRILGSNISESKDVIHFPALKKVNHRLVAEAAVFESLKKIDATVTAVETVFPELTEITTPSVALETVALGDVQDLLTISNKDKRSLVLTSKGGKLLRKLYGSILRTNGQWDEQGTPSGSVALDRVNAPKLKVIKAANQQKINANIRRLISESIKNKGKGDVSILSKIRLTKQMKDSKEQVGSALPSLLRLLETRYAPSEWANNGANKFTNDDVNLTQDKRIERLREQVDAQSGDFTLLNIFEINDNAHPVQIITPIGMTALESIEGSGLVLNTASADTLFGPGFIAKSQQHLSIFETTAPDKAETIQQKFIEEIVQKTQMPALKTISVSGVAMIGAQVHDHKNMHADARTQLIGLLTRQKLRELAEREQELDHSGREQEQEINKQIIEKRAQIRDEVVKSVASIAPGLTTINARVARIDGDTSLPSVTAINAVLEIAETAEERKYQATNLPSIPHLPAIESLIIDSIRPGAQTGFRGRVLDGSPQNHFIFTSERIKSRTNETVKINGKSIDEFVDKINGIDILHEIDKVTNQIVDNRPWMPMRRAHRIYTSPLIGRAAHTGNKTKRHVYIQDSFGDALNNEEKNAADIIKNAVIDIITERISSKQGELIDKDIITNIVDDVLDKVAIESVDSDSSANDYGSATDMIGNIRDAIIEDISLQVSNESLVINESELSDEEDISITVGTAMEELSNTDDTQVPRATDETSMAIARLLPYTSNGAISDVVTMLTDTGLSDSRRNELVELLGRLTNPTDHMLGDSQQLEAPEGINLHLSEFDDVISELADGRFAVSDMKLFTENSRILAAFGLLNTDMHLSLMDAIKRAIPSRDLDEAYDELVDENGIGSTNEATIAYVIERAINNRSIHGENVVKELRETIERQRRVISLMSDRIDTVNKIAGAINASAIATRRLNELKALGVIELGNNALEKSVYGWMNNTTGANDETAKMLMYGIADSLTAQSIVRRSTSLIIALNPTDTDGLFVVDKERNLMANNRGADTYTYNEGELEEALIRSQMTEEYESEDTFIPKVVPITLRTMSRVNNVTTDIGESDINIPVLLSGGAVPDNTRLAEADLVQQAADMRNVTQDDIDDIDNRDDEQGPQFAAADLRQDSETERQNRTKATEIATELSTDLGGAFGTMVDKVDYVSEELRNMTKPDTRTERSEIQSAAENQVTNDLMNAIEEINKLLMKQNDEIDDTITGNVMALMKRRKTGRSGPEILQTIKEIDSKGKEFANMHETLPVANKMQRNIRDAAVAIGKKKWDDARHAIQRVKLAYESRADKVATFRKMATEVTETAEQSKVDYFKSDVRDSAYWNRQMVAARERHKQIRNDKSLPAFIRKVKFEETPEYTRIKTALDAALQKEKDAGQQGPQFAAADSQQSELSQGERKALTQLGKAKLQLMRENGPVAIADWISAINDELTKAGIDPAFMQKDMLNVFRDAQAAIRNERIEDTITGIMDKQGVTREKAQEIMRVRQEKAANARKIAAENKAALKGVKDKKTAMQSAIENALDQNSELTVEDVLLAKDRNKFSKKMLESGKTQDEVNKLYIEAIETYIDATEQIKEAREDLKKQKKLGRPGIVGGWTSEEEEQSNRQELEDKKRLAAANNALRKMIKKLTDKPSTTIEKIGNWYLRLNRLGEAALTTALSTATHNLVAQRATKLMNAVEVAIETAFRKMAPNLFAANAFSMPATVKISEILKQEIKGSTMPGIRGGLAQAREEEASILSTLATLIAYKERVAKGLLADNPDLYEKMIGAFLYGDYDEDGNQMPIPKDANIAEKSIERFVRMAEALVQGAAALNRFQEKHFRFASFLAHVSVELQAMGTDIDTVITDGKTDKIPREVFERAVKRSLEDTFAEDFNKDATLGKFIAASSDMAQWIPFFANPMLFRRFLYNSTKFMMEHSPLILGKLVTKEGFSARDAAKFTMGLGMFAFGYGVAAAFGDDDDDPFLLTIGGKTIRISAYNPVSQFIVLGHWAKRWASGRDPLYNSESWITAFGQDPRFPNLAVEWFRSMIALGGKDDNKWVEFGEQTKLIGVKGLTAFLRPLTTLKDIIATLDQEERIERDYSGDGVLGEFKKVLPFAERLTKAITGENTPARVDPLTGKAYERTAPLFHQLGITFVSDHRRGVKLTPAEEFLSVAVRERMSEFTGPSGRTAAEKARSALASQLFRALDEGRDIRPVLGRYYSEGRLTERQVQNLERAIGMSTLERKADRASIIEVANAIEYASPAEREVLMRIALGKIDSKFDTMTTAEAEAARRLFPWLPTR